MIGVEDDLSITDDNKLGRHGQLDKFHAVLPKSLDQFTITKPMAQHIKTIGATVIAIVGNMIADTTGLNLFTLVVDHILEHRGRVAMVGEVLAIQRVNNFIDLAMPRPKLRFTMLDAIDSRRVHVRHYT